MLAKQLDVTVWYDGACPLCQREIALMQRLDKRDKILFVDLTDESQSCSLNRSDMLARLHAAENGQIHSGAAAFAVMWRAIPLFRPFGLLARNKLILKILQWLYERFLIIRPRLQKLFT